MWSGFGQEEIDAGRYPLYWAGVSAVSVFLLLIHVGLAQNYGFFRDELYYLACTKHLAWGYVDHPPLCVFILKAFVSVFGESLIAVRLPGFLAGAASCFVYAQIARSLGGNDRAQVLSALFVALSPVVAVVTHLYSMNIWDILLWGLVTLCFLKAGENNSRWAWALFGLTLGLALQNKLSALLLFGSLGVAMVFTHRRRDLRTAGPWIGIAIAALIFAPFVLWAQTHDWIALEFIRNATEKKMLPVPPLQFVLTQAVVLNPLFFGVAIVGASFAWNRRPYRPLALAFTLVFLILLASGKSRENYLAPAYCLIIPLGAKVVTEWLAERRVARTVASIALALSSTAMLTFALPVLPPSTFIQITQGRAASLPATEAGKKSPLLGFADMFGWPEMAALAYQVWEQLPPDQRAKTPVLGLNYGESSAVLKFGPKDGPAVIGVHNNFWLWGPGDWDGKSIIIIGNPSKEVKALFEHYETRATMDVPFAVPEEAEAPISLATGLRVPVQEFWKQMKNIR